MSQAGNASDIVRSPSPQCLTSCLAAIVWLLQMIHSGESKGEFVTQTLVAIPLAYICSCAYFSLFKLGNFGFYHMVSNSTYPGVQATACRGAWVLSQLL